MLMKPCFDCGLDHSDGSPCLGRANLTGYPPEALEVSIKADPKEEELPTSLEEPGYGHGV